MILLCPLCKSSYISLIELIDVNKLYIAYNKIYNIDFIFDTAVINYCKCESCKLFFFNPPAVGDGKFYEMLQTNDWYYVKDKYEYSVALKYISNKCSVLEVGSGAAFFAEYVGADRYVGLEFNDKAIARAKLNGITLLKEPIEFHAHFAQEMYDVVVSFQVLEHVLDPAAFIKGCLLALKPGGKLIVAVPSADGCFSEAVNHLLDMPPHHLTRWTHEALVSIANIYGLTIKKIEYEPVAIYHLRMVSRIFWEKKLRKIALKKKLIFDYGPTARLLGKIANALAGIFPICPRNLKGHTVIAVYEKG